VITFIDFSYRGTVVIPLCQEIAPTTTFQKVHLFFSPWPKTSAGNYVMVQGIRTRFFGGQLYWSGAWVSMGTDVATICSMSNWTLSAGNWRLIEFCLGSFWKRGIMWWKSYYCAKINGYTLSLEKSNHQPAPRNSRASSQSTPVMGLQKKSPWPLKFDSCIFHYLADPPILERLRTWITDFTNHTTDT